ncbi:MAG: TonB-dependent receptor [Steroidobacteraceae bacterium]
MRKPSFFRASVVNRAVATAISTATLLLAAGTPAHAAEAQASGQGLEIEEVVVSARKREESLLETPIAITAITADTLAAKGVTSFGNIAESTPGINISNISSGRSDRSFQQITLRGFVPSTTLSTLTATFIDGAPVASPTAVAAVHDPARVEILKGPQAAYFGRNTFAGAINVVNKEPGTELGGSISLMSGSRSNVDIAGSVDGPIGEHFGFRVSGHMFQKDGSYDNAASPGQTLGDQKTETVTALLTARATDNFTAKLFGLYSKDDDGPSAQGMIGMYEVRSANGLTNIPALTGSNAGAIVINNQSNCSVSGFQRGNVATESRVTRPFICGEAPKLIAGFSPTQNTVEDSLLAASLANPRWRIVSPSQGVDGYGLVREYQHVHLNLDWKLGESGFTLSSLSSLNQEYWSEVEDLDNYDTRMLVNPSNPTGANPNLRTFWDFVYGVERKTYDASQELRLGYDNGGAFSGVIGASYLKTNVWNDLVALTNEVVSGTSRVIQAGKNLVETNGVFFGLNYKATDSLKISAEGRFQKDKVTGFVGAAGATVSASSAAQFGIPAGRYAGLQKLIDKTYNNFLPRLIVSYDLNPDVMAYASFSKGVNVGTNTFNTSFLSGSSLAVATAADMGITVVQKPEKLTNYDLGLKGKFLDGRLVAQIAAYYAVWTDQLNLRSRFILDLPVSQGGTGATQTVTGYANTGEAALTGLEVELTARPTENLDVSLAAAMNDSSIRSYNYPELSKMTGIIDEGFRGKKLPLSSRFSANLGVQYGTALSFVQDGRWFARADLSWKDKMYGDASNITWISARTVVNFRAGVSRGPLSVDAFVNNAFNDDNYTSIASNAILTPNFALSTLPLGGYLNVGLPELRTYGARISYKF